MQLVARALTGLALLASVTAVDSSNDNNNNKVISHVRNANHIFNALHSSMRQWGSAWNHNGMSFFLASVPAGTQFYHGTRSASRINGTEWLAFEPEHALSFARIGPPGGGGGGPPGGGPPGDPPPESFGSFARFPPPDRFPPGLAPDGFPPGPPPPHGSHQGARSDKDGQKVMSADDSNINDYAEEEQWGYLHTYAAAKDLRLLYLDGLSAGKTTMGTMDSGDRVVLGDGNLTHFKAAPDDDERKTNRGPGDEYARAVVGCEIAKNDWDGRIDGFLRTEAGFEIILCDFARDLDVVRITAVAREDDTFPGGFGNSRYFYISISSRFNGIGGERVKVNYDNFVTAFAYEDLDLFNNGQNEMPRLDHFSTEELQPIRDDLLTLVMEHETVEEPSFNWQAIVDMVVTKYSNFLMYLVSDEIDSLESMQRNITNVFLAFIDGRHRDAAAETERCTTQFIPALASNLQNQAISSSSLAGQAVYDVSHTICSTLRSVLDDTDFSTATTRLTNLIEYLAWTTWKECKTKCGYNQACYIPIWPFGTVQDRLNPQCKDGTPNFGDDGESYWRNGPGGGKPPRREQDL